MENNHARQLQEAEGIVTAYGHLLAELGSSCYAHPQSRLPADKEQIKSAIHVLLWELQGQQTAICNSLAQSYVYLAQFVEDSEAAIVARGESVMQSADLDPEELRYADQAAPIIDRIKADMEELMLDVKAFLG